jgi:hypothetical protein
VDVLGSEEVLLARGGDDHHRGGDAVEPARDASAGVEHGGDGVVVEDGLSPRAGGVEPEADVVARLVGRERREAGDGGDALIAWAGDMNSGMN